MSRIAEGCVGRTAENEGVCTDQPFFAVRPPHHPPQRQIVKHLHNVSCLELKLLEVCRPEVKHSFCLCDYHGIGIGGASPTTTRSSRAVGLGTCADRACSLGLISGERDDAVGFRWRCRTISARWSHLRAHSPHEKCTQENTTQREQKKNKKQ